MSPQQPLSSLTSLEEDEVDSLEGNQGVREVLLRQPCSAPMIIKESVDFGENKKSALIMNEHPRNSRQSLKTFRRTSRLVSRISKLSRRSSVKNSHDSSKALKSEGSLIG